MQKWDWKVVKSNFSRLDVDLKSLVSNDFEIYQIIGVHEVKPAKIPFEVVVISRKPLQLTESVLTPKPFTMHYQPPTTKSEAMKQEVE